MPLLHVFFPVNQHLVLKVEFKWHLPEVHLCILASPMLKELLAKVNERLCSPTVELTAFIQPKKGTIFSLGFSIFLKLFLWVKYGKPKIWISTFKDDVLAGKRKGNKNNRKQVVGYQRTNDSKEVFEIILEMEPTLQWPYIV